MQNRYLGDIGDFGKFGLLRALCQKNEINPHTLPLGVIWYLVQDELGNNDGQHIDYLLPSSAVGRRLRQCDPALYDLLAETVWSMSGNGHRTVNWEARHVASVRERGLLPSCVASFERPVSSARPPSRKDAARLRQDLREIWLSEAVDSMSTAEIVFLCPDNGLEVASVERGSERACKYVFLHELEPFVGRGQSLIVYHHLCRRGRAIDQVTERLKALRDRVDPVVDVFALIYHRGSARAYVVLPASPRHHKILSTQARAMVAGPWGDHFELIVLRDSGDGP